MPPAVHRWNVLKQFFVFQYEQKKIIIWLEQNHMSHKQYIQISNENKRGPFHHLKYTYCRWMTEKKKKKNNSHLTVHFHICENWHWNSRFDHVRHPFYILNSFYCIVSILFSVKYRIRRGRFTVSLLILCSYSIWKRKIKFLLAPDPKI